MSDSQFTPPAPPTAKRSSQRTVLFAAATAAVAAFAIAIAIVQFNDSTPETFNSDSPIEESQSGNKYDDYYQYVRNESGMANSESKAMVIEFGDFVCGLFDAGASVEDILSEMKKYTVDSQFRSEYAAAVMFGSTMHLCPEYEVLVEEYLG